MFNLKLCTSLVTDVRSWGNQHWVWNPKSHAVKKFPTPHHIGPTCKIIASQGPTLNGANSYVRRPYSLTNSTVRSTTLRTHLPNTNLHIWRPHDMSYHKILYHTHLIGTVPDKWWLRMLDLGYPKGDTEFKITCGKEMPYVTSHRPNKKNHRLSGSQP